MGLIKIDGSGEEAQTSAFNIKMEAKAQELIDHGEKTLEDDWENVEAKTCSVCKGSGIDLEEKISCYGCEGSGKSYEVRYGVSGGHIYANVSQWGLEFFKEMCKAHREAEVESVRKKRPMLGLAKLPPIIEMEFKAAGIPVDELMTNSEGVLELARIVKQVCPEYLTTNLQNF